MKTIKTLKDKTPVFFQNFFFKKMSDFPLDVEMKSLDELLSSGTIQKSEYEIRGGDVLDFF